MKKLKLLTVTVLSATVLVLTPMQAVQAAKSPAQACGMASSKVWNAKLKEVGRTYVLACKGKPAAAISSKGTARVNKKIAKANKLHEKLDCNANKDQDLIETFPIDEWPADTLINSANVIASSCDGIDDPD